MNALLAQAAAAIEAGKVQLDMTETTAGGFEKRLLGEGTAIVQFTQYIDHGIQKQKPFKGQPKKPAKTASLGFHILAGIGTLPDGTKEPYVQDGKLEKIRTRFDIALHQNEKAGAVKIFNALNYAKDATHFVQKLGSIYLLSIGIEKGKDGKEYNTYDFSQLQKPIANAMTGAMYEAGKDGVADTPAEEYQLFLWDAPTKEQWDSIFIEGEYDKKTKDANGNEVVEKKSKNFIQEKIRSATNFKGSPIDLLLISQGEDLPALEAEVEETDPNDQHAEEDKSDIPAVPAADIPAVPAV